MGDAVRCRSTVCIIGKIDRHRCNRSGDRQANRALHMIGIGGIRTDERSHAFVDRKTAEGKSKLETIR